MLRGGEVGVELRHAALQFVLANPAIDTVLIGPRSVAELDANFAAAKHPIPTELWDELVPWRDPRAFDLGPT